MSQKWLMENFRSIEDSGRQIGVFIVKEVGISQKWLTKISGALKTSVEKSEF